MFGPLIIDEGPSLSTTAGRAVAQLMLVWCLPPPNFGQKLPPKARNRDKAAKSKSTNLVVSEEMVQYNKICCFIGYILVIAYICGNILQLIHQKIYRQDLLPTFIVDSLPTINVDNQPIFPQIQYYKSTNLAKGSYMIVGWDRDGYTSS